MDPDETSDANEMEGSGVWSRLLATCMSSRLQPVHALLKLGIYYGLAIVVFRYIEDDVPCDSSGTSSSACMGPRSVLDCIYFSTVLMSTVGYGDVKPANTATRALAVIFALFGLVMVFREMSKVVDLAVSRREQLDASTRAMRTPLSPRLGPPLTLASARANPATTAHAVREQHAPRA